MKSKEQFDREIKSFKETLRELKQKNDVKDTTASSTIDRIIAYLGMLELELKRDVFISFIEQTLNIKLNQKERRFIIFNDKYGEIQLETHPMRSTLIEIIKLAYNGEDIIDNIKGRIRLIRVPKGLTYTYKGVKLPCETLYETMNKLYNHNWRYYIK